MTKNLDTITIALALILETLACGPALPGDMDTFGGDGTSTGGDTTGDGDGDPAGGETGGVEGDVWAEIRCFELSSGISSCAGRPVGSDDAWVMVVAECEIAAAVELGALVKIGAWTDETCASGKSPSNFMPESNCYWVAAAGRSACFAGGDGWYTSVVPACDASIGDALPWADWQCVGVAGSIGQHPWDSVICSNVESSVCAAFDDNDAMMTWPTCWVDQWEPAPAPACGDEPGDGDGDCEPGTMGCACATTDLDGDGVVPAEGECYLGLTCNPDSQMCEPS